MALHSPDFTDVVSFLEYARASERTHVIMSLTQGQRELGTILLELYVDLVPRTCANFLKLVDGSTYRYKGSPIHRIVTGGYVQGGDVVDGTGKGNPGLSIPDESFQIKHDVPGIVGMANLGQPHTASAQFYITQAPLPWLDGQRVAFGRVVTSEGRAIVCKLEESMLSNERPVPDINISDIQIVKGIAEAALAFPLPPVADSEPAEVSTAPQAADGDLPSEAVELEALAAEAS